MDDIALGPTRHKLTAEHYYRMVETGILGKEDRVELIDGEIIDMAPIGQDHMATVNVFTRSLVMACGDRAIVSIQNSIRIDGLNAPQPDVAILRPRADFYRTGERASPADVLLLIEVADSSLRYDRLVKLPLYARAGIAEVWIADLDRRVLDVHRKPDGGAYTAAETYRPGDTVTLGLAPDIAVALRRVFD